MTAPHSISLVGLNVNGASATATLSALLREAKRKRVHVLLLQEHHLSGEAAARATTVASRCDFKSFWSSSDSDGHRGGVNNGNMLSVNPVGLEPTMRGAPASNEERQGTAALQTKKQQ